MGHILPSFRRVSSGLGRHRLRTIVSRSSVALIPDFAPLLPSIARVNPPASLVDWARCLPLLRSEARMLLGRRGQRRARLAQPDGAPSRVLGLGRHSGDR